MGTPLDNYYESDPLYTEILPGLFMGGTANNDTIFTPAGVRVPREDMPFKSVVTMFYAARPVDWGIHEMRYHIIDGSLNNVDLERLGDVVSWAYKQWKRGDGAILIRCQAGVNRSGLVTSLVLMKEGYSATKAISLIQNKRFNHCMQNGEYIKWLEENGEEFINNLR